MTGAVHYNPYDYHIHEDPYPTYTRLRSRAPLYHNEDLGFWALSRHEDVNAGFHNTTDLSSSPQVSLDPLASGPITYKTMSLPCDGSSSPLMPCVDTLLGDSPTPVMDLEPRIRALAVHYLDEALEKAEASTPLATSLASSQWT